MYQSVTFKLLTPRVHSHRQAAQNIHNAYVYWKIQIADQIRRMFLWILIMLAWNTRIIEIILRFGKMMLMTLAVCVFLNLCLSMCVWRSHISSNIVLLYLFSVRSSISLVLSLWGTLMVYIFWCESCDWGANRTKQIQI